MPLPFLSVLLSLWTQSLTSITTPLHYWVCVVPHATDMPVGGDMVHAQRAEATGRVGEPLRSAADEDPKQLKRKRRRQVKREVFVSSEQKFVGGGGADASIPCWCEGAEIAGSKPEYADCLIWAT